MKTVLLILFLLPAHWMLAQTELNAIGSIKYLAPIATEPRVMGADFNDSPFDISLSAGVEAIFRGGRKRLPVIARMEYGWLVLERLTNDFLGTSVQGGMGDGVRGQLVGHVRFQSANYLQGALGIELIPPNKANKVNVEVAVGGLFFLNEQVHAATSWIDPSTGRATPAAGATFRDVAGNIVSDATSGSAPGAGNLILSQNLLRRFTPYLELNFVYRAHQPVGFTTILGLQVGLQSLLDETWYNTTTKNGWWIALKGTFRGRII